MAVRGSGGSSSAPKLLVVESPAKVKTISKFLGSDFKVMSTFGHIKDLPERKLGVEVDDSEKDQVLDDEALADMILGFKDSAPVIPEVKKKQIPKEGDSL